MGALDRIFRRRQEQQRPLESYVRGLWRAGEQGVWYDPSDLTTLFQDVGGSTPVTAVGQPVGLMLDKRYGPTRGSEQAPADISAGWSSADARWTYAAGSVSWAGGGGTNLTTARLLLPVSFAGKFVELSYTVTGFSGTSNGGPDSGVLSSGPGGTGTLIDTRFSASGTYRFMGYWRGGGSVDGRSIGILGRGTNSFTISNLSVREVPGNHASQGTATSRPTYGIDGAGRPKINFDGVDDWMQVASCDLSMNNKLLVSAAVKKSQNSVAAIFVELSVDINANPGTFYISAPEATGPNSDFRFRSRGSSASNGATTTGAALAGTPFVVTGTADMAVPVKSIRLNGILKESSPQDQGVGNFGNYPMYLGRRGGSSSLFFAGDLYGLIIRGAATPDPTISRVERYLNAKSRAY